MLKVFLSFYFVYLLEVIRYEWVMVFWVWLLVEMVGLVGYFLVVLVVCG